MPKSGCTRLIVGSPTTPLKNRSRTAIAELNDDPAVSAFIVQYPFPKGLDYGAALLKVDPAKDADGLHPTNLGLLVMGEDRANSVHAARDSPHAPRLWSRGEGPPRRHCRPWSHHRTSARQPVGAQDS
ncbi:MAG: tetrahydrofolate dehydrogenase/cyclohydrolase catalytic domain-containing protein [Microthrixaceae bacterium]